jgi:hypothetical protein
MSKYLPATLGIAAIFIASTAIAAERGELEKSGIKAATDCVAAAALKEPNITTLYREDRLDEVTDRIVLHSDACDNPLRAMRLLHDRLYGKGTGRTFLRGDYLADLPRAVRERISDEVDRDDPLKSYATPFGSKEVPTSAKILPTPAATPNPPSSSEIIERTRVVVADQKFHLDFLASLEADCSPVGFATIRIIQQAEHGEITFENGTGFSNFAKENIRYECNKRRTEGVILSYEPSLGYTGLDSLTVDVIFASGNSGKRHYTIEVK